MAIDWKNPPYDHRGRWEKKYDSIMDPTTKVTWPQLIAEFVVFFRTKVFDKYKAVQKGRGWSHPIAKDVRSLNQQAAIICNYFPHPDDEPMVVFAVKKFFRDNKPLGIGGYRKKRTKISEAGREVSTITQTEKDTVLGINVELMKVVKSRDSYALSALPKAEAKKQPVTFSTEVATPPKKGSLAYLLALEKQMKSIQGTPENE